MAQLTKSALSALINEAADPLKSILQDIFDTYDDTELLVKEYRAKITQSGTSNPVATVFKNTLGFTPTWNRSSAGSYALMHTGGFPDAKTFVLTTPVDDGTGYTMALNMEDAPDQINFDEVPPSGSPGDDNIWYVLIKIYP